MAHIIILGKAKELSEQQTKVLDAIEQAHEYLEQNPQSETVLDLVAELEAALDAASASVGSAADDLLAAV